MPSELKPLVKLLDLQPRRHRRGTGASHHGSLDGDRVVATTCGIGTARARAATEQLLRAGQVDHVIVIGVAGGITAGLGELVVPAVVVDAATETTYRPSALGSQPGAGILYTSDAFLTEAAVLRALSDRGAVAIDMETSGVAAVCERHGCAWSVFRGVSDDVFDPAVDDAVLALTRPDGSPNLGAVARFVAARPTRLRLLARLARDLGAATSVAASAAVAACREHATG
jgi:adenosylhomocysteine nucleosidase